MPLPKISHTQHSTILPTAKKEVAFRPFLVKEEKALLIAQESKDDAVIFNSITQLIESCVLTKGFSASELSSIDLEWLFLQIRKVSVGETSNVNYECPKCGKKSPTALSLDAVKVEGLEEWLKEPKTIKVNNDITITLKNFITTEDSHKIVLAERESESKSQLLSVGLLIDKVFEESTKQTFNISDSTDEEIVEFVESLPVTATREIEVLFGKIPSLTLKHEFKCLNKDCGETSTVTFRGLRSFFQ